MKKNLLGVLLLALLGLACAQTRLAPVTALEFAPEVPLPSHSYRAFLPFCLDTATVPTRCYYLAGPLADSLESVTAWMRVRSWALTAEETPIVEGRAEVRQTWTTADRTLWFRWLHMNGEVALIVARVN